MNSRITVMLSVTAGFLAVLLAIWAVNRGIVQPAFVELEQAQALEDGARAWAALQGELRQLGNELGDWAEWDDAYAFAENHDPAFVQSNLGDWRVLEKSSHLNFCVILARDGQLLYQGGYDSDLGGEVSLKAVAGEPPAILALLQPVLRDERTLTGLLSTEHGLLLLAARPILTTQGAGPARGVLAFGRFLDMSLLRALAERIQVRFELFSVDAPDLTADERALLVTLPLEVPTLRSGPGGHGFVYEVVPNLLSQPVALLRTPIRQEISATARRTSRTLLATLGLAALVLVMVGAGFSARLRHGESAGANAVAWGTATLAGLIGMTLTAGLFWELRQQSRESFLVLGIGAGLTLLLALHLYGLVSQRQRAEALVAARTAELQANEHRFRNVVEHAPFGLHFYHLESDDRLVFSGANPAADTILKFAHADRVGQVLEEMLPALVPTAIPTTCRRLAREGGVYRWEALEIRDSAIAGTFEMAAFQTVPDTVAVIFNDITERQQAEQRLRQSEEKFAKIFLTTPDLVVISRLRDGRLLEVNPGFEAITGYSRTEAVGRSSLDLALWVDVADRDRMVADLRAHGQVLHRDFSFQRKDGALRTGQFSARPITVEDESCLLFIMQDHAERQQAEAALRASEERYRLLFERAHDAIFVMDRQTGRYLDANRAAEHLTGRTVAELRALRASDITPTGASKRLIQMAKATETIRLGEVVYRQPDGSQRTAQLSVIPVNDTLLFGMAHDITELKTAERRIEHLAYYDPLTDLPNRALLTERAELALALAARHRAGLAVLFLDLDRFKEVNDSLGHAEGDALLVQVAKRLQEQTRETDTVCRLGGDEFVLLLTDVDQDGALQVTDKLLAAFRQPFVVAGQNLRVTMSIGIALYPHDGQNITDLLKNADTALYQAKQDGRNTRTFYDRAMNVATFERLVLESELRKALATGQLRDYYQPQVRLADGHPVGAEVLVRWLHPDHGLITPGRFIPLAETSDLIVELGNWMLDAACRQLVAWREAGLPPLTVAINLAARHFRDSGLVARIQGLLAACELPPQALELELTESILLEAGPQTAETLLALERLGVGLAIDDFGTGYSNIGYLKRLPLSALKIDQSFVHDLASNPNDCILAATIITLGHSLELKVVAEGVETEEQRRLLLERGCDLAQGYLFSPPVPAETFTEWLIQRVSSRSGDPS